jgi:pimeloyl-ACP methyl ester carboxylesterase
MRYSVKKHKDYRYMDEGKGPVLLLLHGLFGALSNWDSVIESFQSRYRVVIPVMPIYEMPIKQAGIDGLVQFVEEFVRCMELQSSCLLGNSLGGHVAMVYCLRNPDACSGLILTGSSGLFENAMGGSFPRRGSYGYIKERVEYTFFDPQTATKELIDEVYEITSSIPKCLRIVSIAKSAQRHNMAKEIIHIKKPTLLVWGLNDTITPPLVAYEFNKLIQGSELHFIDRCGHAPMMEQPARFNALLTKFLQSKVYP